MNILHMKYAFEVARAGSLGRAAESLLIAQPNLSRSIKDLEAELGITIFNRTAKGMVLTPEGEEFIGYAEGILHQIEQVEHLYKHGTQNKQHFSVSVPRACYISEAFAQFSKSIPEGGVELFYKETNSARTIHNILDSDYKLGILRYAENYDKYFTALLEEKGLEYEMIAEFTYVLVMSRSSPLADIDDISFDDLKSYIEIAHADPYVPSLPASKVVKSELPDNVDRRIFVFERASQFDLLSENPETFMWVSPIPQKTLDRYGLITKGCRNNTKIYKDILVYKKNSKLTALDRAFIEQLHESKSKYLCSTEERKEI